MENIEDYGAVGNGTTDCTTAINNALAVGDIFIPEGTFRVTDDIVVPASRVIEGAGDGSILYADDNYTIDATAITNGEVKPILRIENNDIDMRNFKLLQDHGDTLSQYNENSWAGVGVGTHGTGTNDNPSNITMQGLTFEGMARQCVYGNDAPENWIIDDCKFLKSARAGAVFVDAKNITVQNSYFNDVNDDAIAFNQDTERSRAINNRITNVGLSRDKGSGFKCHGSYNLFEGNIINGFCSNGAISVRADGSKCTGNRIINNIIRNPLIAHGTQTVRGIRIFAEDTDVDNLHIHGNIIDCDNVNSIVPISFKSSGTNKIKKVFMDQNTIIADNIGLLFWTLPELLVCTGNEITADKIIYINNEATGLTSFIHIGGGGLIGEKLVVLNANKNTIAGDFLFSNIDLFGATEIEKNAKTIGTVGEFNNSEDITIS